ncbi:hypothetical protein B0H21DRAFT_194975 [Amylocystis lapponica]|nr:hypothetical protein B0H21DRAFT_194975 [Amylocystis lapponica]
MSQTPTLSALSCDEILVNIFQYLNLPHFSFNTRGIVNPHLSVCARVCRAFLEPALGILWRDLNTLTPLVEILSSRWYDRAQRRDDLNALSISDKERFKQYANRVRMVSYTCHGYLARLDPDIILDIVGWSGEQYLLPNLQNLTLHEDSPSDARLDAMVKALVVPSLKKLDFGIHHRTYGLVSPPPTSASVSTLLAQVLATATSLEDLHLVVAPFDFPISPPPFIHIQRLQKVFLHLASPSLTLHFLRTLSRLDTLTDLTVRTSSSDWNKEIPDTGGFDLESSFPRLRSLRVDGPTAVLSLILSVTSSPSMESLILNMLGRNGTSPDNYHTFFSTLRSKATVWSETLRTVTYNYAPQSTPGSWPQFQDFFQPLLVCKGLRNVQIDPCTNALFLTDEDVTTFAHAWPGLTNLYLGSPTSPAFDHVPSFPAVADMIRRTPQLRELTMPWRIDNAGMLALQSRTEPISVQLESMNLDWVLFDIDVSQARPVGELLERLFPRANLLLKYHSRHSYLSTSPEKTQIFELVLLAFNEARSRNNSPPI